MTLKETIKVLEARLEDLKQAHKELISLSRNKSLVTDARKAFASEANRIEGKWKELSRTLIQIR